MCTDFDGRVWPCPDPIRACWTRPRVGPPTGCSSTWRTTVAPPARPAAWEYAAAAVTGGDWHGKARVVRVNDWSRQWTYRAVTALVEGAGEHRDCVMVPKVEGSDQVFALDLLCGQVERALGLAPGGIRIEAQVESARELVAVDAIAAASPRLETLIFGPADFVSSISTPARTPPRRTAGGWRGDAWGRDDRRSVPEDGPRHRREGTGGGSDPSRVASAEEVRA